MQCDRQKRRSLAVYPNDGEDCEALAKRTDFVMVPPNTGTSPYGMESNLFRGNAMPAQEALGIAAQCLERTSQDRGSQLTLVTEPDSSGRLVKRFSMMPMPLESSTSPDGEVRIASK